jgi:pyruvate dehydrogenase E2 component (dihydrolipoyllysine-residue acetyltransferase)
VPKNILLPEVAADFESGTIEGWLKDVGDRIDIGDPLIEVSTDKAVVEVEAEEAGILGKILIPAGSEEVAVNTPIAILLHDGETVEVLDKPIDKDAAHDKPAEAKQTDSAAVAISDSAGSASTIVDTGSESNDHIFASPLAKRIAGQLSLDLNGIEGSGPGGRIVLGDVESAAARQGLDVQATAAPAPTSMPTMERPPPGTYTEMPADKIRQIIAQRLAQAKREIPHFYLTVDCELDRLLDARQQLNESAEKGARVSINDFFVKASAMALQDVPGANTGWSDQAILKFNDINIAVAVSTPNGLITPVVCNADGKSLMSISTEIKSLVERAREGRLKPEEYKGGGFTISNLGMYGVREFSAIINPPQSCILAVGAGEQRAIVRDGQLVAATLVSCTLSVDHRAVDGALGAEFLQALKQYIEKPARLIL